MIRAVFVVLNGNIIAQIIALAALPVISRLYPDEAFGEFQLFISVMGILLPFAALRLEIPLLKQKDSPRDITLIVLMCIGINFGGAALLALILLLVDLRTIWPEGGDLVFPAWLLPFGFLAFGALQTFSSLAVRENAFWAVSRARVLQSFYFNALAIGAGWLWPSVMLLVITDIASRVGTSIMLFRASTVVPLGRLCRRDLRWMLSFLSANRRYPMFAVPSGVLSGLTMGLPVLAMSTMFEIGEVGQFSMAYRLTLLPLGVLAFSVSQVVTGRFATTMREEGGPLRRQLLRIEAVLFALGLIAGAIVVIFSKPAVDLVLGDKWTVAGVMMVGMVPMVVSTLAVAPLNTMLTLLGYQRTQFAWDTIRIAALIAVFALCSRAGTDVVATVQYYSWTAASFSFAYLMILLSVANRPANSQSSEEE